jgi:hypothetical protein
MMTAKVIPFLRDVSFDPDTTHGCLAFVACGVSGFTI